MSKKLLSLALAVVLAVLMSAAAYADLDIKPVEDPWDNPENLEQDGGTYYAYNDAGYIVAWETPECSVNGEYKLLENGKELTVDYRVTYMESVPWGHISIELGDAKFSGWVLMTDLVDKDGNPAAVMPPEIPEHPMITNPPTASTPEPTEEVQESPSPSEELPTRPQQAITVSSAYNSAIVYTSIAIAVIALALVVYVILKHKATNKNGE